MVFLNLFEVGLLFTAWQITIAKSVKGMIAWYRYQSFLLAFITVSTALIRLTESEPEQRASTGLIIFLIILIGLLPVGLGIFIEGLLVRATIVSPQGNFLPTRDDAQAAERIWLKREGKNRSLGVIILCGGLIALATWVAFIAIPETSTLYTTFDSSARIGLMVSLSLHLIGLYNTVIKGDTVSQVVGLLTMDHGLYLAVVKIVAIPVPATFFVISLYFYTLITLAILIYLLPQVRRLTGSVDLDIISNDSELKG